MRYNPQFIESWAKRIRQGKSHLVKIAKNRFLYHSNTLMAGLPVLIALVLGACGTHPKSIFTTTNTQTVLLAETTSSPTLVAETSRSNTQCLRPGVHTTNDAETLPLPTVGYELYVVGESHGEREVHLLALDYLEKLHKGTRVRDIILEQISSVCERDVNAYVLGLDNTVSPDWSAQADMVVGVRMFNDTLADSEKVRIHLVDVDHNLASVYAHLQILQEELGASVKGVDLPSLAKFKRWDETEMLALVDRLVDVIEDPNGIANEITTVRVSIRHYFVWRRFERREISESEFIAQLSIREERIAQNVQYLLEKLDGAPVLALYGGYHAQKRPAIIVTLGSLPQPVFLDNPSWVQHLSESGVSIYSVLAEGVSGQAGGMDSYHQPVERDPHQMHFSDGTTLGDVFDAALQYSIVYVDLRLDTNRTLRLGDSFQDIPAGEIYDGLILFRTVSPVEWENPLDS